MAVQEGVYCMLNFSSELRELLILVVNEENCGKCGELINKGRLNYPGLNIFLTNIINYSNVANRFTDITLQVHLTYVIMSVKEIPCFP